MYVQDRFPWQRMWKLVGEETDSEWRESRMENTPKATAFRRDAECVDEGSKLMRFTVIRK